MLSKHTPDLSYRRLATKGRHLTPSEGWPSLRIALLSDAASQQFVPVLRALFAENQVNVELFEGAFDGIELEVFDEHSALYDFDPNTIVLALSAQALRNSYFRSLDGDFVASTLARIQDLWSSLRSHSKAQILQFNYAIPSERYLGTYDVHVPGSLYAATKTINALMAKAAMQTVDVTLCDVDAISANIGRSQWFDDRLWNMTKAFCKLDFLPIVCQNVTEILLTQMGRVRKCVILDLDNTLWGGVVGDQGHLGVEIGPHGDGEAFWHFQHYILGLKKRGVILAVCSKNDLANALEPFDKNPDMVLKRSDIALFVANWDNKADNIRAIRENLNIGLDSMVFLDDSPFERNLVRQMLPDICVPELPEDPAEYVQYLSSLNLFETRCYSAEDVQRTDLYKRDADRTELRMRSSDIDEYLGSLEMTISIARFDEANLSRIAQLTQRSNQFNVTTRRRSEGECNAMMLNAQCIPLYAKLADRFGDHGLISVVSMLVSSEGLLITDWLMSCRVLARGVEEYLMNHVINIALTRDIPKVCAEYIPTAKNSMVKDLFTRFGFSRISERNDHTRWVIDPKTYIFSKTYVRAANSNG